MAILDTSAIIHILKSTEIGKKIVEEYEQEINFITSPSIYEIMYGIRSEELEAVLNFINSMNVLPYDRSAAFESAEIKKALKKDGKMMQNIDIMIAAIAKNQKQPIITTDKGFNNIENVEIIIF